QFPSEMEPRVPWNVAFRNRQEDGRSRLGCEQAVAGWLELPGISVVTNAKQLVAAIEEKREVSPFREPRRPLRRSLKVCDYPARRRTGVGRLLDESGDSVGCLGAYTGREGQTLSRGLFEPLVVSWTVGKHRHPTRGL